MKKLLLIFAVLATVSMSGCSFVKDVQKKCKIEVVSGDIQTGSFKICGACDSTAHLIWDAIKKEKQKQ